MESAPSETPLRALPSVDLVLRTGEMVELLKEFARPPIVRLVRACIEEQRLRIAAGSRAPNASEIAREVAARAADLWRQPRPAVLINATGVILHTNMGRAPLSVEAQLAARHASSYCDLEYDVTSGERGTRQDAVKGLFRSLTDAEACHVFVNNAAAILVALSALARGKEVIVSRGQAVEIGGGFRVPVILRQSGARLVEVGTTNRTRVQDYEDAVTSRTAAILHVHSSNFRITGFTESVPLENLATLARRHNLALIDDNGSGALLDTARFELTHEPTPTESLDAGADIVAFSGDKLLGGPQCGIILGRHDVVERISRHPLSRATRPDKLTLAALAATLLAYIRGNAEQTLPTWRMIALSKAEVAERAEAWRQRATTRGINATLHDAHSTVGGGSLPGETLPTTVLVLPREITAAALRRALPPVVARTQNRRVQLDLRTVFESQEGALLSAVAGSMHAVDR